MKKTFPEDRVNLGVNKITPYQPGKSSDSLNISKEKLIKLASNENPIGPSKLATKAISHIVGEAHRFLMEMERNSNKKFQSWKKFHLIALR